MKNFFMLFTMLTVFCFIGASFAGQPAARLGDMTAHGGTITEGCATVLIGGMPAARLGDWHSCPMVTPGNPPIPHVGGAIITGSAGVLIGGKPAARVGDMASCVGPPDTIVTGCMTVLIGDTGASTAGNSASQADTTEVKELEQK